MEIQEELLARTQDLVDLLAKQVIGGCLEQGCAPIGIRMATHDVLGFHVTAVTAI